MVKDPKFYICEVCGNQVALIHDGGGTLVCCGQDMKELVPNTSDGAGEKHVPVYTISGDTVSVQVGEVIHPMLPEHYIMWIRLETEQGGQRKVLAPGDEPKATFVLAPGDKPVAVYEYCNIHGLWKADIK